MHHAYESSKLKRFINTFEVNYIKNNEELKIDYSKRNNFYYLSFVGLKIYNN